MKVTTYLHLGIFSLLFFLFSGCEDKDDFYLIEGVTPSNITLSFTLADDDSGELTVYPQADGATQFRIEFGDDPAATPTEIQAGGRATHIYQEGNYTMRVVAVGINGSTAEVTQNIVVQFRPPENLVVDIQIDPANSFKTTVTPSADNATLFEVFFGYEGEGEATVVMAGGSAEHTYADTGTYVIEVIARSLSATTLTFKDTIQIVKTFDPLNLPINFESDDVAYNFASFGNVSASVIDNPDKSGINESDKVAMLSKPVGAETWGGTFLELPDPIDFSNSQVFRVKVWSPKAGATVRMKLENATDGEIFQELDDTTATSGAWEELQWDFSGLDLTQPLHKIVLFFDFGNEGDDSDYFFDDIFLGEEVMEALELPIDFESSTLVYGFNDFGNVASEVIDNPDKSGLNTSERVAKFLKPAGAETWGGTFLELPDPIDFSLSQVFKVKAWSPKPGVTVRLKLENATDGGIFQELDDTTSITDAWEELEWDFSSLDLSNPLHKIVIFFDFGNTGDGTEYFFDDIWLDEGGEDKLELPLDFESTTLEYLFIDFGNAATELLANPEPSGINTSANVVKFTKQAGAETWAGTFIQLPEPIDFSSAKNFKIKSWSPNSDITVLLKIENETDGSIFQEISATVSVAEEWEELTFDFNGLDLSNEFHKIVIFYDFGNVGDGSEYYFDDITLVN